MKRELGRSRITVSAMGAGLWAIGGPWTMGGGPAGWGEVDDEEEDGELSEPRCFAADAAAVTPAERYSASASRAFRRVKRRAGGRARIRGRRS